ncbi:MAG: Asp23/Gls24 family envelope stress response protein [Oscillospiraceae bacterium]
MDIKNSGQKASLKISQEVLETIAKVAALEIKGVASIAESQKGLGGMFSKNTSAIETTITDGVAEISVSLN